MSGEPLFDPSLKKRSKKKQVAFSEDPLGADADPTVPAPSLDNTTASGDVIDLGPKTVHEQMKQNEAGVDDVASELKDVKEEDDFKAMFGDLKKKKKKKDIPLDLVRLYHRCFCCHLLIFSLCIRVKMALAHPRQRPAHLLRLLAPRTISTSQT
jgi:hypothetical protein